MRSASSRLLVVCLGIALGLGAVPARAESPERAVREFLALAYEGHVGELAKAPAARTERFERQIRNILRVRCIRADQIAISKIEERPEQITLHADVALAKRDRDSSGAWSAVEIVPLRVELTRHDDRWRVAEIRNRDEEYAEQLLQAGAEERERRLREQPERLSAGLARALYALALANLNAGTFKEATVAAAMALQVAREAGDRAGEALALAVSTYTIPKEAGRLSEESLAIAGTVGEPDVLARAWYDRGRTISRMGHLEPSVRKAEMMESYQNARRFARRAEDPTILVRVLYSRANSAANQGDFLGARQDIDEALSVAREVEDVTGEMSLEMVLTTVYVGQGDHDRALFHQARATDLAEKTQALAYPTLLVRSGCLLVDLGRYDEARVLLDRAVVRTATGMASRIKSMPGNHLASALQGMARIEADRGNFSEAECLNREGALHHGDPPDSFLYELAPHYSAHGNHAGALALSLASLAEDDLSRVSRGKPELYPDQRLGALRMAGQAYRDLGLAARGLAVALEAIDLREDFDTNIAGDEQQRAVAANATSEYYELAAELTLAVGDPVEALALLERGRARAQTDILENGRPGSAAELEADVRKRQSELDREIALIRTKLDRAEDKTTIAATTERLNRARAARASFLDGVSARSERRRAVRRRIDAAGVLALAAQLPPRTVAVEYFAGEHELHIFVLGETGVSVRTKRVERKTLDERVGAFLEMLTKGDLRVETRGRDLYSLLVEPVEKDIAGAETLLVIPDDSLWSVPFAALIDGRGRFLVESKALFYAPSMTAWSSVAGARRRSGSRPVSLLAIANPTLDPAAGKAAASFYRSAALGPLPEAEHEVDALRALYDPGRAVVLKRDQATEERTKTALREASVAHFATHAILDDANPMYSRLMLARDGGAPADAAEDGWLESWEVARLDLDADLIVLSACDTARGDVGGGEGVIGLAWSFFLAGASSTLATQWKVASDSTAEFMIAFHRALRAPARDPSLHKARAVREAQLQCLRDARTSHPFHWAAFVLLGDPSVRAEHVDQPTVRSE